MHARCCSLYSTSCEHDARPRASTNEMGLRYCKARSPMLVVERAWPAAPGSGQAAQFTSVRLSYNFWQIVFKMARETDDERRSSRVGRKQTAFYPAIVTRFAEVGDGWRVGTNKIRPSRFPRRPSGQPPIGTGQTGPIGGRSVHQPNEISRRTIPPIPA